MPKQSFEIKNRWNGSVIFTAEIDCDENASINVKLGLAVRIAYAARADLADANLARADLADANLADANLADANLARANLARADLADANLAGAYLAGAYLAGAYLAGAYLARAYLARADLAGANLAGANLAGANLADANLADANLAGAKNLTEEHLRFIKADFWMTLTENPTEVPAVINALKDGRVNGSQYTGECACLVGTIANARSVDVDKLSRDSNRPAERWFLSIKKGDRPGDETAGGFASAKALQWAEEWMALHNAPKAARAS